MILKYRNDIKMIIYIVSFFIHYIQGGSTNKE